MNDPVSNPQHYNLNGIEVIDVIETYAKDDFRLANVIKYVCRCDYKGKKLEDLQKAAWYLNRVIKELEAEQATADWAGIDRGVSDWTLDDYEPPTPEEFVEQLKRGAQSLLDEDESRRTCTPYEEDIVSLAPVDQVVHIATPREGTVHPSPDRIAGDDAHARGIKDEYYKFNRFEIKGYCAWCDAEIHATQPYVTSFSFDPSLKFCNPDCTDRLIAWQKSIK